jgi:DNA-binding NarL/FixJ family response regulator
VDQSLDERRKALQDTRLVPWNGQELKPATHRIKKVSPHSQVIVVTSYHENEHIFPAIRAGALSYVVKDIDPDELAEAIQHAAVGEAMINPRVAARMVKEHMGGQTIKQTCSLSLPIVK